MKKIISLLMVLGIFLCVSACGDKADGELTLMAPDGAPALAVASILSEGKIGGKTLKPEILSGVDEIAAKTRTGESDISVMPINVAAKLYNAGVNIKLVSVNVAGCLYMVGKTGINSLSDLKGKVVYNIGEGGTPDLTFRYILSRSGIEYELGETPVAGKVVLNYVSAASMLVPLLKKGAAEYGIMGEPAVTNCNAAAGTVTVLDLQREWKAVTGEDYTQAGVVVKGELALRRHFVRALSSALNDNEEWITSNASSLKEILTANGSSLTVDFTADIISRCNVRYTAATEAKGNIEKYLGVLLSFEPQTVGGKLPDDGFYFGV